MSGWSSAGYGTSEKWTEENWLQKHSCLMLKTARPRMMSVSVIQLKNRFQALGKTEDHTQPHTHKTNTQWKHIEIAYQKSRETCLWKKQRNGKEWLTADTQQTIEKQLSQQRQVMGAIPDWPKKKAYKLKDQEANQEVKRKTRADD